MDANRQNVLLSAVVFDAIKIAAKASKTLDEFGFAISDLTRLADGRLEVEVEDLQTFEKVWIRI